MRNLGLQRSPPASVQDRPVGSVQRSGLLNSSLPPEVQVVVSISQVIVEVARCILRAQLRHCKSTERQQSPV